MDDYSRGVLRVLGGLCKNLDLGAYKNIYGPLGSNKHITINFSKASSVFQLITMAGDSRMLSATEVRTLIRGVRMYGSERWSDVQQRYFSDEEHLTIDELKETWKNLVKMAKNHKRRAEHLPKEIWAQVLEADG